MFNKQNENLQKFTIVAFTIIILFLGIGIGATITNENKSFLQKNSVYRVGTDIEKLQLYQDMQYYMQNSKTSNMLYFAEYVGYATSGTSFVIWLLAVITTKSNNKKKIGDKKDE